MVRSTPTAPRINRRGVLVALAVMGIAGALIVFKTRIAVIVGPRWDSFAFLSNAAEFAGRGYGYSEPHRPPVISLLTALAWLLGAPMRESTLQWVDAALSFSSVVAFYALARKRFAPLLSGVGALAFLALTPLWSYLGSGYTDFGSVGLSIWMLLLVVNAVEVNDWYYLPAGLLFLTAVMTRYTSILAVFPVLVYVFLRGGIFRHARALTWAIVVTALAYAPLGWMYAKRFGDIFFPFAIAFAVTENVTASLSKGPAAWYYLRSLPGSFAPSGFAWVGWVLFGVAALGLSVAAWRHISGLQRTRRMLLALAGPCIILLGQVAGGLAVRQVSIAVGVWIVWRTLAPRAEAPDNRVLLVYALDAMFVAWLLAYFSFHGSQSILEPRYFIAMAPGLVWLLMLGWQQAAAEALGTAGDRSARTRWREVAAQLAPPIGMGLLVAASIGASALMTSSTPDVTVVAARESAQWLASQPSNGAVSGPIYSDLWPYTAWYLRAPVRPMPFFQDSRAFGHELDKSGASYFITIARRRFSDFVVAKQFGVVGVDAVRSGAVTVLQRVRPSTSNLPRVALLGTAWDNYVETVCGYDFFLTSDAGRYGWEGTAFLDSLDATQLAGYPAVAVYAVRWRDRALGEANLNRYLDAGGSVVMDASRNIGTIPFDMNGTVMFNTVIQRGFVSRDSQLHVSGDFAAAHPEIGLVSASPFVSETGGGWYGAEYTPLPGSPGFKVLATVGGKPVVVVRQVGKGRVYWIGYNLVWHAFLTGNSGEARLVKAVFDDAIASSVASRTATGSAGSGVP